MEKLDRSSSMSSEGGLTPDRNSPIHPYSYDSYSSGDLGHRIEATNYIYGLKSEPSTRSIANDFKKQFTKDNQYIKDYSSQLTASYDPKDPTMTPFVKALLDQHPFFAKRIYDEVLKNNQTSGAETLAKQVFDHWNQTPAGRHEETRQTITAILDHCLPELSQQFRALFKLKKSK